MTGDQYQALTDNEKLTLVNLLNDDENVEHFNRLTLAFVSMELISRIVRICINCINCRCPFCDNKQIILTKIAKKLGIDLRVD